MQPEYCRARDLEAVVSKLIEMFYPDLIDAELKFIVIRRSEPFKQNPNRVAQIEKVFGLRGWLWSKKDNTEGEEFFLIQVVTPLFDLFDKSGKIAVLDHEICHVEEKETTANWGLRDHTIEEFPEIVRRHGSYHFGLMEFDAELERGNADIDGRKEILRRVGKRKL